MYEVKFEELSPAEWFRRNKEVVGFTSQARATYQAVKELIENSLDATEAYGILPTVKVRIEYFDRSRGWLSIYVEDNGIGIPKDEIPNVFGKMFYGSKYRMRQQRGVLGLGVKMIVLYAQMTTSVPVYVRSSFIGSDKIYEYTLMMDTLNNRPIVLNSNERPNVYGWHGTAVKIVIEGDWSRARKRLEEYLYRTHMIAPYAELYFKGPDLELYFSRLTKKLPRIPKEGLPHPKSIDVETIKQLIARSDGMTVLEFLVENFDGVGRTTALSFLRWAKIDENKRVNELTNDEIVNLVAKMKEYDAWKRPSSDPLSPIGEDILVEGVSKLLEPEFITAVTRKPRSYAGHPFIVEVVLAWGGKIAPSDKVVLYRCANKVPLLYDEGVDVIRKVVDSIDWRVYKVTFPAPLALLVHVCSTKIPYTSPGKEAIADVAEIREEVELAIREAARRLKSYIIRRQKEEEEYAKYRTLMMYGSEVISALAYLTNTDEKVIAEMLKALIKKKIRLEAVETDEEISRGRAENPQRGGHESYRAAETRIGLSSRDTS